MPRRLPAELVETVKFEGVTFRRYPFSPNETHRRYFNPGSSDRRRGVESLHREIFKRHKGPIPAGFDVHHRDDDPLNNDPENLEAIHPDDHKAIHAEEGKWTGSFRLRRHLRGIARLAADWHASQEGILWHRAHARQAYAKRQPATFECAECGVRFESKHRASVRPDGKRFCSERCTGRTRRRERRQFKALICSICGHEYQSIGRGATCSRRCAARLRWASTGRRRAS
jgi:hypothetical protein